MCLKYAQALWRQQQTGLARRAKTVAGRAAGRRRSSLPAYEPAQQQQSRPVETRSYESVKDAIFNRRLPTDPYLVPQQYM